MVRYNKLPDHCDPDHQMARPLPQHLAWMSLSGNDATDNLSDWVYKPYTGAASGGAHSNNDSMCKAPHEADELSAFDNSHNVVGEWSWASLKCHHMSMFEGSALTFEGKSNGSTQAYSIDEPPVDFDVYKGAHATLTWTIDVEWADLTSLGWVVAVNFDSYEVGYREAVFKDHMSPGAKHANFHYGKRSWCGVSTAKDVVGQEADCAAHCVVDSESNEAAGSMIVLTSDAWGGRQTWGEEPVSCSLANVVGVTATMLQEGVVTDVWGDGKHAENDVERGGMTEKFCKCDASHSKHVHDCVDGNYREARDMSAPCDWVTAPEDN